MDKISGIYCIENKITNKKYIGKSVNIYERWRQHKIFLRHNKHHNKYLQFAWNKYGENTFDFYIIEECIEDELNDKEIFYIQKYDSTNNIYGYNLTDGGDGGNTLIKYTDDEFSAYCKKRREILKGKIPYGENAGCAKLKEFQVKEIIQRLLKNDFNYNIAKDYNISCSTINDIRHHKTWKYLTDGIVFDDISKRKNIRTSSKKVIQYDLKGNKICEYKNARIAAQETGIGFKQISQVCNGYKRMAHGFVFRFDGDAFDKFPIEKCTNGFNQAIDQYDLDGNFIRTYNTISQAEKEHNCKGISAALRGISKTSAGYIWKYHVK